MEISVGTYSSVRYLVEVRYWECPLIESSLYLLSIYHNEPVGTTVTTEVSTQPK